MPSGALSYAALAMCAGIGIPVMAAMNASLSSRIVSTPVASGILFLVAGLACLAISGVSASRPIWPSGGVPFAYAFAGLFVAFYILVISWLAPRFGLANAIFFVLLGQMLSATFIDHFGLIDVPRSALGAKRFVGLLVMAAGIYLARRPN